MDGPFAAAFGGLATIAGPVVDNYNDSTENREEADSDSGAAEDKWSGDRQTISSEWSRISDGFEGEFAPSNAQQEAFKTWAHQQIWDALNGKGDQTGVTESEVNAGADGWRRLVGQLEQAIDEFGNGVDQDINEKWSGATANAAMEGTRTYTDTAKKLPSSFQMVANGIDMIQGYLGQAKMSVEPPVDVSGFDEFVGHIPGNGVVKANKHRANEAEARAQDMMIEMYQPGVTDVDGRTPILPPPNNPVTGDTPEAPSGPGSPSAPGGPPGAGQPAGPGAPRQTDQPGPGDPEDQSTQPPGQPENTTPASSPNTQPTTPASTPTAPKPQLEDPIGRPNSTTTPGTPGTPSGPSSPGTPNTPSSPAPGKGPSTPGAPKQPGQQPAATPTSGAGTGRPGMRGMPAMAPPGGRGNGGNDEDERNTPEYLVQDRTTELLGEQPRVLPPGGVIGE